MYFAVELGAHEVALSSLCIHSLELMRFFFHQQMETQAEEQAAEAQKERKLRERNEQYSRQLEEELEGLKVRLQTACSRL